MNTVVNILGFNRHFSKTILDVGKEYFGFGYMQAPNTIYKNIYQVNPGELLKISLKGELSRNVFKTFNKENDLSPEGVLKSVKKTT